MHFVRHSVADKMIAAEKSRRDDLTTRHLRMAIDSVVFLNWSLCKSRQILLAQIKREKKRRDAWVSRYGRIKVIRVPGEPVKLIITLADLNAVIIGTVQ